MNSNFLTKMGVVATIAASSLFVGVSWAETVELGAAEDVTLLYTQTGLLRQNFLNGGATGIGAALHGGAPKRGQCSLLRFDLSQIPKDAVIEKAELELTPVFTYRPDVYTGNERLVVYQLAAENAAWVEGTGDSLRNPETDLVTVPGATGGYVNMTSYTDDENNDGVRWLSGPFIGPMDFSGDELGSFALRDAGLTEAQAVSINLRPEAIQDWMQSPDLAKAGLALWMISDEGQVAASRFAIFMSKEQLHPPRLVITYKLP
jgi:hypothetical protein